MHVDVKRCTFYTRMCIDEIFTSKKKEKYVYKDRDMHVYVKGCTLYTCICIYEIFECKKKEKFGFRYVYMRYLNVKRKRNLYTETEICMYM